MTVAAERYLGAKKKFAYECSNFDREHFCTQKLFSPTHRSPVRVKKEKYIRSSLQNNFLSLGSISYYSFPRRSLPHPLPPRERNHSIEPRELESSILKGGTVIANVAVFDETAHFTAVGSLVLDDMYISL